MGAGGDRAGLGSWMWARDRGNGGIVLRVVSVYRPCTNKRGPLSVYAQHQNYFQGINDDTDPIVAWLRDFKAELQEWIDAGDQIIVGGDINGSVFEQEIINIFEEHFMTNLIYERHDPTDAPKTYEESPEGRVIDGVWATPGIHAKRCGYLRPGLYQTKHSLISADITFDSALGHNPPLPPNPDARRLQLFNSKVTKKYLDKYEDEITKHQLPQRQFRLEASTTHGQPLSP